MDKKGELSSQQIVGIVILLIGFGIIVLLFYNIFNNNSLTNRELCRLSILSRATVPGVVQQQIPLDCGPEKICITNKKPLFSGAAIFGNGGGDCKQFAGEENVRVVEVKVSNDLAEQKNSLDTIQREVANSMFDCWYMTGQGKLDIFTSGESSGNFVEDAFNQGLDAVDLSELTVNPKCIVCSRIAFSDSLYAADVELKRNNGNGLLEQLDYNSFMSREKVPGTDLTYIQAFTDESVGSGYGLIARNESEIERPNSLDKPTNSSQIAIIFTQIKINNVNESEVFWNTFRNGAILGGVAAISGPGKVASLLLPGPGWMKALFKVASIGAVSYTLAAASENTVQSNQAISAATCGTFESTITGGNQKGCSLVKLMDYSKNGIESINELCKGGIEGRL